MSFPYNRNLPNPPDDPSEDVSGMRENAGTINSWVAIDHVGFNNSQGGYHNKATFIDQGSSSPSGVSMADVLYAKTVNSVVELWLQRATGSAIQLTNGNVLAASNGYSFLPGGLILQWLETPTSVGGTPFSFPLSFPTNVFAVTLGGIVSAAQSFSLSNISQSGGIAYNQATGGSQRAYIMAIGN